MVTTVLVVDDHRLLRESLRRMLELAGLRVVGEAGDGVSAVSETERLRPDVVLMDVEMPGMDGIEATRQLRARAPETHVIILSMHADADIVARARRAGATGFLGKDVAVGELAPAVARAASGALVLGPGLPRTPWVEDRVARVAGAGDVRVLSDREAQILQLVADGVGSEAIAQRLFLSPKTVRNHLSNLYAKLGVSNRADAIVAGLRAGFIRLD